MILILKHWRMAFRMGGGDSLPPPNASAYVSLIWVLRNKIFSSKGLHGGGPDCQSR